jgi:hypothetical protein
MFEARRSGTERMHRVTPRRAGSPAARAEGRELSAGGVDRDGEAVSGTFRRRALNLRHQADIGERDLAVEA